MSNETKEKTTAEIAAENPATINEAGAVTAEEMAHVAATLETAPAKKVRQRQEPARAGTGRKTESSPRQSKGGN